jgi:hypothetical protein
LNGNENSILDGGSDDEKLLGDNNRKLWGPAQKTPNFQMAPTPKKLIRIVEYTHLMVVLKFRQKIDSFMVYRRDID